MEANVFQSLPPKASITFQTAIKGWCRAFVQVIICKLFFTVVGHQSLSTHVCEQLPLLCSIPLSHLPPSSSRWSCGLLEGSPGWTLGQHSQVPKRWGGGGKRRGQDSRRILHMTSLVNFSIPPNVYICISPAPQHSPHYTTHFSFVGYKLPTVTPFHNANMSSTGLF